VGTFAPPIIVSAPAPASQTAIKEFQPAIKELLRTLYRQSANLFVGGTMSAMISNFPTPATPRQDQPGPKRANSSDKSTQGGIEQNEAGRREENFKTGALNHSATLPSQQHHPLRDI